MFRHFQLSMVIAKSKKPQEIVSECILKVNKRNMKRKANERFQTLQRTPARTLINTQTKDCNIKLFIAVHVEHCNP